MLIDTYIIKALITYAIICIVIVLTQVIERYLK